MEWRVVKNDGDIRTPENGGGLYPRRETEKSRRDKKERGEESEQTQHLAATLSSRKRKTLLSPSTHLCIVARAQVAVGEREHPWHCACMYALHAKQSVGPSNI